jgi:hypothetical protein
MTVESLLQAAQELSRQEQLELLDGLVRLVKSTTPEKTSITELQGLGQGIWEGIDGQEYVDAERRSWGG